MIKSISYNENQSTWDITYINTENQKQPANPIDVKLFPKNWSVLFY